MIQRCRVCGTLTGGLIPSHYESSPNPWPQRDVCPQCPADAPNEELDALVAVCKNALDKTRKVRQDELRGEIITPETMSMILKGT